MVEASPAEIRVLGCLIEKQRSTPSAYPLSVNALTLACNQTTNRDPVVEYDEATVREAAQRLGRRGWARFASGRGSRAPKYRHTLDDALGLSGDELSVLCVLMLRGAQTPGELKARTDRLHAFSHLAEVQDALERLARRELVAPLPRSPGQKEQRYGHLLGGDPAAEQDLPPASPGANGPGEVELRIARLEEDVRALREAVEALRRNLA